MSRLEELIAELEKATGPDRELDTQIWLATTPGSTRRTQHVVSSTNAWKPYDIDETRDETGRLIIVPSYTASIDAAVALVERVLPGAWYLLGKGKTRSTEPLFGAQITFGSEVLGDGEHDHSLAVALCIAALKAKLSQEEA